MYALADLRLVRSLLDQEELGAVRRARQCGKSWTDIGVTLGMSPQAAWKRWHEDNEPEPVG
jgi:hypothetical protein